MAETAVRAQAAGCANGNNSWRTFSVALLTLLATSVIAGTTIKCGVDDVQTQAIHVNSIALGNMAIRILAIEGAVGEIKDNQRSQTEDTVAIRLAMERITTKMNLQAVSPVEIHREMQRRELQP
jgi:hypothetical protein